jgi:putative peptidoglycan lipid II flippase
MLLICLVAVAGAVLNVRRHFAVPAAAPMILNLGIIGAILGGSLGAGLTGIPLMYAVCAGVLAAGVGQIALSGLALKAVSFFPVFGAAWRDPQVRTVARLMGPMILGLSAVQINSLVDYLIAYLFIQEGGERVGPAVLGYAQYLYQLPLGVFGIAIATAVFPALSRRAAEDDRRGLADTFVQATRLSLFIALPASVGLMFVAGPLVATLYQRGEFDAADTQRVSATLLFYSIGLAAYFTQHIVVRTWYALHDSRTPARVALSMVGVNFAMNLSLVFVLQERGLALATAVCALIQVVWLSVRLGHTVPEIAWRRIGTGVAKMLTATALMAAGLGSLVSPALAGGLLPASSLVRLVTLVAAGVVLYAISAQLLRIEEWHAAVHRLRRSRENTG